MKPKVLLVKACVAAQDMTSDASALDGYDITQASNGPEALNALRTTGFDLVLLDLELPASNGWNTLSQIVTVSLALPIIVIVEGADRHWLAAHSGVTAILEKPLHLSALLETMERVLAETAETRHRRIGARNT